MILLNDSSGNTWQIAVDDSGNVSAVAAPKQEAPTALYVNPATGYFHTDYPSKNNWNVYLAMNGYPGNSWALGVTTAGALTKTSVSFDARWPLYLPVVTSPGGILWRPYVDAGGNVLAARSWFDSPNAASFGSTAGQLDPYPSEASGKAVMPGPTTQVIDPDIWPEEMTGWFRSGCGHSLMTWELAPVIVGGQPMVQVRCPYDGYVNSVRTQAEIDAMLIVIG